MLPFKPRKPLDLQVVKMYQLLKMLSFSVNRGSKNHIDKILKCETQRLHNLSHDKQARDRGTKRSNFTIPQCFNSCIIRKHLTFHVSSAHKHKNHEGEIRIHTVMKL